MIQLLIMLSLIGNYGFAGPNHGYGHGHSHGHSHAPIDPCKKHATKNIKKSSVKIGRCHINRLIKKGKINKSWKRASYKESLSREFKGRKEWVVIFNNKKGVMGKIIYIFLNRKGGFIAANFSGK